jgi:hypothetical protein
MSDIEFEDMEEKAHLEGWYAFQDQEPMTTNPYDEGTALHNWWNYGWEDCMIHEAKDQEFMQEQQEHQDALDYQEQHNT